jgi:amino acid adenylation domain-containing protein
MACARIRRRSSPWVTVVADDSAGAAGARRELAQQRELALLLHHVWDHSEFYREYYAAHGIREGDLAHLSVRDLPFITRQTLMAHFDSAVTDRRLRQREIEQWIDARPEAPAMAPGGFVVLKSSGTSGTLGIYVYDQVGWRTVNSVAADRLPGPEPGQTGKTRVAFYVSTRPHSAAVTTSRFLSPALHDVMVISVFDPPERVVARLEAFQPHRLVGYSSAVTTLAEWAQAGRLRIAPRRIVVSSDRLTPAMEATIGAAWRAPIHLLYVASESVYLGIRAPGEAELTLLDDLNIVEILDSAQRPVGPGESGRVVLTNLYNYALPVLRYELGDEVVRGGAPAHPGFTAIRDIQGLTGERLPALLDDGSRAAIPPELLLRVYVPGLERLEFVSLGQDEVRIDYVADQDQDATIAREFTSLLAVLGARRTRFSVQRVAETQPDPRTGKVMTVRLEWQPPSPGALPDLPVQGSAMPGSPVRHRLAPTNPFTPFPRTAIEQSVAARFEEQVAAHAARPAIVAGDDVLTYADLNRRANRLARALLAREPDGPGPVALLLGHGAPTIAAMLAVLKAGKIFVPLDPTFPPARLHTMLEDARATVVVAGAPHGDLAISLSGRDGRVLEAEAVEAAGPDDDLALPIAPEAPAYILYTSGSTGEPRGVVQSHRTVLHNIMKYTNGAHLAASDRITMLLSFGFSAAMTNTFGALLNGAALVPLDVRARGLAGLSALLHEHRITIFKTVPSTFRAFCADLLAGAHFPALRLVELVGEPVTPRDVERFRRHFPPPCLLHNRLGATEMHVIRQQFLDAETPVAGGIVPVGYAVDDTEILILDDLGQPLGENGLGEIAIRSPFLAVGYWRRPDLTREAFTPHPTAEDIRTYRTGDLGLIRPDGCLEHHGRKDAQAKIRGQRIAVGEIEDEILALGGVAAAAVAVREDHAGDPRLVAYVVAVSPPVPATTELRKALGERLTAHMIPSTFVWLPALPLAPTGKVDRRALPSPPGDPRSADAPYAAPRTPFEERLARIWTEVLGLDRIGVHDDFFDLGGHSLLAMRILSRVQEAFQVDIPVRRFLEAPTVAAQATTIVECRLEGLAVSERDRMLRDLGDPPEDRTRGG